MIFRPEEKKRGSRRIEKGYAKKWCVFCDFVPGISGAEPGLLSKVYFLGEKKILEYVCPDPL
jgi:hypothetical protein